MPRKKASDTSELLKAVEEVPVSEVSVPESVTEAATVKKKRGRKPAAEKTDKQVETVFSTIVQAGDSEYNITDVALKAYKIYKSTHKRKVVKEFRVYVKPEEGVAYFTVNGEGSPDFKIDL